MFVSCKTSPEYASIWKIEKLPNTAYKMILVQPGFYQNNISFLEAAPVLQLHLKALEKVES